jgi:hypothetical protein
MASIDKTRHRKPWTDDEIETLRDLAGSAPISTISTRLQRKSAAIRWKMRDLNISGRKPNIAERAYEALKPDPTLPKKELARRIGADPVRLNQNLMSCWGVTYEELQSEVFRKFWLGRVD